MLGKSLFDLISDKRKQDFADSGGLSDPEADPAGGGHEGDEQGFRLQLRRRRKAALFKQMLIDGGYGDLAKTVSVKEI